MHNSAPCAVASRLAPETWSACTCVSITYRRRKPRSWRSGSYCAVSIDGSTIAASCDCREAIRYEAQPHRSSRICLKYMTFALNGVRLAKHAKHVTSRRVAQAERSEQSARLFSVWSELPSGLRGSGTVLCLRPQRLRAGHHDG